jgi:hypothetical protein
MTAEPMSEILTQPERRRRRASEQKLALEAAPKKTGQGLPLG